VDVADVLQPVKQTAKLFRYASDPVFAIFVAKGSNKRAYNKAKPFNKCMFGVEDGADVCLPLWSNVFILERQGILEIGRWKMGKVLRLNEYWRRDSVL
jgi:hypothetical protein